MKEKETTSGLFAVIAISAISLEAIGEFVANSASAAYINAALVVVFALAGTWVTNISFSKTDLFSGLSAAYGKTTASFAMVALFCITIFGAGVRIDMFSRAIGRFVLEDTSEFFIKAVFALCAFFASYYGIGSLSRYGTVCLSLFFIFFAIIFSFSVSEVRAINIFPVLGKGNFGGVIGMMYIFADVIYAYVQGKKGGQNAKRSILIGGTVVVLTTLFYCLCVPYPFSTMHEYPFFALASLANSSVIFQRLDGIVFAIWMLGGFVSVGALCFFATRILSQVFELSDPKALSGAVALLTFLGATGTQIAKDIFFWSMIFVTFAFLPVSSVVCKLRRGV